MSLFFKHIFRSMKRALLQPLLICLAVMLAVATAVTALRVSEMFADHSKEVAEADLELGDVVVTMRGDSTTRILFDEDARALLGNDATVLGVFSATAFLEREEGTALLDVAAVDLEAADAFYKFQFLQYGHFTDENIDRAAVISASAAEECGLSLGDSLEVKVLGELFTYTIEAVAADTGLLSQSDLLVSLSGVIDVLADRVPVIASLGSSFAPYSRLMIKAADGVAPSALVDRLSASPLFADKTVAATTNATQAGFFSMIQAVFVWVIALLLMILAGFLIATSLKLLHTQRSGEYALFCNAGASPRQIAGLVIGESLCYAVVGCILGILLAVPMLRGAASLYAWQRSPLTVGVLGVVVGIAQSVLLMLICTLLHLRKNRSFGTVEQAADLRVSHRSHSARGLLIPLMLCLVGALTMALLPVRICYIGAFVVLFGVLWLLCVATPLLLGALARLVEKRATRPAFLLAIKSIRHRFALRHVGRLLAVVLCLILTMLAAVQAYDGLVDSMTTDFPSDIVAINVSDECKAEIAADPAVAGVMEMTYYTGTQMEGAAGITALSLSGDTLLCGDVNTQPRRIPTGREVAISKGLAALVGAKVGETVTVTVKGVTHELTVSEIMSISANFIYFDKDEMGLADGMFCIRLVQDVDATDVIARLTAQLEAEGATVVPLEQVFEELPHTLRGHMRLLRWSLLVAAVISIAACGNVLAQQYRARATEREMLAVCGMEKRTMRRMHLWEALLLTLVGLAAAALAAGVLCLALELSLRSFGMVLFA